MDECRDILETFPLGKTPGNDGFPIEFYIVFLVINCKNLG